MKKNCFLKWITLILVLLTFVGAWFVIKSGGEKSAGYAVIPSIFAIICAAIYNKDMRKK